ncbi:fibronectin type III domain protein [Ancylostoma caninum]|uniref:Fibronectin type III domain protein n=1 Tax=Ancylostoma caninum TaxID=29170 RepID=A0A368GJG3_ANCCA|nr:fibronectin type III domain protein [Ancylostoma caninum]
MVPGIVRGYTVSYGVATPSRRIVIEGANTNSFTLNRLEPDTDYVFAVGAYNEADGEDGEPVLLSARTLPSDGKLPGQIFLGRIPFFPGTPAFSLWPPIAVRAHSPSPGVVTVTWEDPNPEQDIENEIDGTQRHYLIQYGIYQSEQLSKMRSNSRNVKLTGLLPGKEYEIAVKVVGDDGRESPWSIRDIVLTPPGTIQLKKFHVTIGNATSRRTYAECETGTVFIGFEPVARHQLIVKYGLS